MRHSYVTAEGLNDGSLTILASVPCGPRRSVFFVADALSADVGLVNAEIESGYPTRVLSLLWLRPDQLAAVGRAATEATEWR